jgi:hypothetical protein
VRQWLRWVSERTPIWRTMWASSWALKRFLPSTKGRTPQLAEQHLHHLEQTLSAAAKQAGVTVERKASLLSLVFEPTSAMHAQAIRDEVNYNTEVTWNESSHTATDPPMAVIMVKIFLFIGLFLGFATGVGIAFGGLRVIVKRLFPGKVFDRPEDIEVLQLGLSGKKIDASDMY